MLRNRSLQRNPPQIARDGNDDQPRHDVAGEPAVAFYFFSFRNRVEHRNRENVKHEQELDSDEHVVMRGVTGLGQVVVKARTENREQDRVQQWAEVADDFFAERSAFGFGDSCKRRRECEAGKDEAAERGNDGGNVNSSHGHREHRGNCGVHDSSIRLPLWLAERNPHAVPSHFPGVIFLDQWILPLPMVDARGPKPGTRKPAGTSSMTLTKAVSPSSSINFALRGLNMARKSTLGAGSSRQAMRFWISARAFAVMSDHMVLQSPSRFASAKALAARTGAISWRQPVKISRNAARTNRLTAESA